MNTLNTRIVKKFSSCLHNQCLYLAVITPHAYEGFSLVDVKYDYTRGSCKILELRRAGERFIKYEQLSFGGKNGNDRSLRGLITLKGGINNVSISKEMLMLL